MILLDKLKHKQEINDCFEDVKTLVLKSMIDIIEEEIRNRVFNCNNNKDNIYKRKELAKKLHHKFSHNNPTVLKYLKKELPLVVRLFTKVTIVSSYISDNGCISYAYYFNNDIKHVFTYNPYLADVEKWS